MPPTPYAHVNALLDHLLAQLQTILGEKLVGLYLFGSLVTGDYDDGISDVDLLAALQSELDEREFAALKQMHDDIARHDPQWDNHIEVAYLSLRALRTFKTHESKIGIISPGEPFHIIDAGKDWLVNWYVVREQGVTLFGPPPRTIIEPVSKEEFIDVVKSHLRWWREHLDQFHARGSQAYAILTMCRALYTIRHGEQVSKRKAALWAANEVPAWSRLIHNALAWREGKGEQAAEATMAETRRFVRFVIGQVLG